MLQAYHKSTTKRTSGVWPSRAQAGKTCTMCLQLSACCLSDRASVYMYSSEFRRRRRASCWGCLGINVPRFQSLLFASPFLPRDAMLKRYLLSSCVRLSVCPSVCHKLRFYRNDWTNRAGFWHGGFLPPVPHRVPRKFVYLQKLVQCTCTLCTEKATATAFI